MLLISLKKHEYYKYLALLSNKWKVSYVRSQIYIISFLMFLYYDIVVNMNWQILQIHRNILLAKAISMGRNQRFSFPAFKLNVVHTMLLNRFINSISNFWRFLLTLKPWISCILYHIDEKKIQIYVRIVIIAQQMSLWKRKHSLLHVRYLLILTNFTYLLFPQTLLSISSVPQAVVTLLLPHRIVSNIVY